MLFLYGMAAGLMSTIVHPLIDVIPRIQLNAGEYVNCCMGPTFDMLSDKLVHAINYGVFMWLLLPRLQSPARAIIDKTV